MVRERSGTVHHNKGLGSVLRLSRYIYRKTVAVWAVPTSRLQEARREEEEETGRRRPAPYAARGHDACCGVCGETRTEPRSSVVRLCCRGCNGPTVADAKFASGRGPFFTAVPERKRQNIAVEKVRPGATEGLA
jgi:hypothetical protein